MEVYTNKKAHLLLNEPPLRSGGEGSVYEIQGFNQKYVAKIYTDAADAKMREEKILQMIAISKTNAFQHELINKYIAWPILPIYNQNHEFIGFGMERISANIELDDIYTYPPSKNKNISIRDRIDILISLCDAIEHLHNIRQIFGDFNPNNIKVNTNSTVCFVDADSYHIHASGKEYPCIVCAEGYVAPEIVRACNGKPYAECPGKTFTKESDYHALAIHIFRMLENGCHPFSSMRIPTGPGSAPAPLPIDKRVELGITPYFMKVKGYIAPYFAPDVDALPPYILNYFHQALVEGNKNPSKRPTASEWKKALKQFRQELKCCQINPLHYYWKGNSTCPYCEADQRYANKKNYYLQKMGGSINSNIQLQKKVVPQITTVSPQTIQVNTTPVTAAKMQAYKTNIAPTNSGHFWRTTLLSTILIEIFLVIFIMPNLCSSIYGSFNGQKFGLVISAIAGFCGTILYNWNWSPGRKSGYHATNEYFFSSLVALGFSFGIHLVLLLVGGMLYLTVILMAIYAFFYIIMNL